MIRRSLGYTVLPLLVAGIGADATPPAPGVGTADVEAAYSRAADAQAKGRYKKQGDNCVWDATDGGPNQCTPQIKGRFKKGAGDACTWDATDVGDDQCRPPKGRWR